MKAIILSDLFFKLNLVKDCFSFLENNFDCKYDYFPDENDLKSKLIIGWGSGCLKIFENINIIDSTAVVLISPYLDFDRFFSWFDSCENYEKEYFEKSDISNIKYYNHNVDITVLKHKKVFLKPSTNVNNLNIFIGGKDKLVNPEDSLKLDFFFKSTSIHYLEDLGFAPFFENNKAFAKIFKEYIIDEYFRPID